jgi:hypothetical protein
MRKVESDQRWGTPYDAAAGLTVAVKNGWLYQDAGEWHINSLGAFTGGSHTYVMAVMTEDNSSESGGISEVDTLAKAVNTRILGTSTKIVATKTAGVVTMKAVVTAKPTPSVRATKASPSPSPSASASTSASQYVAAEPLATSPVASTGGSGRRVRMTITVLAGATAPGGLLLLAARRRRLFATGPDLEVEPEAAASEPAEAAPSEAAESGKSEPDNVVPDNPTAP